MRRWRFARLVAAGLAALGLAVAAIALVTTLRSGTAGAGKADAIVNSKGDRDAVTPGKNAEASVGGNERRGPDATPEVEAYLQRAYPADEIPIDATLASQRAWASLSARAHSGGTWQLIGPSKATYPAVLNVLGDGDQYVTAGRVTAMAICSAGRSPVSMFTRRRGKFTRGKSVTGRCSAPSTPPTTRAARRKRMKRA